MSFPISYLENDYYICFKYLKMKKTLIITLCLGFFQAFSQDEQGFISQQIWLDYNPSFVVSNKLSIYGDVGARTIIPNSWFRYNLRAGVNYKPFILTDKLPIFKNLQIHAGIGDFYTQSVEDVNINELRLYQGVRVYWPNLKRVRFSHYLRFEERFENLFKYENTTFTARARYLLGAKIQFKKEFLQDAYLPLSVEFFMSLGDGLYFNDVMRITPGVGYNFSDLTRMEFQTSYHNSRNSASESFQNNDLVFRLRLFHIF